MATNLLGFIDGLASALLSPSQGIELETLIFMVANPALLLSKSSSTGKYSDFKLLRKAIGLTFIRLL